MKLGKFSMSNYSQHALSEREIAQIFKGVAVVQRQNNVATDCTDFIVDCDQFEPVDIPTYTLTFHRHGDGSLTVTWKKQ